ncbi:MAG: DUF4012 domain-containing protein [Nakamurella sp.]
MPDRTESTELPASVPDAFDGPGWGENVRQSGSGHEETASPKRRRKVSRSGRRLGFALTVAGGLVVLAGLWLLITGLQARSHLNQARDDVRKLRDEISAGDLPAAHSTAADLAAHAQSAHSLTTGPAWAVAAGIPGVGRPVQTIRGLTASIDGIGNQVLPELVTVTTQLDPARLRNADGSINLSRIAAVAPALDRASAALAAATTTVAGLPARTWLSTIDGARSDALSQLTSLSPTVHSAILAARIAPQMLGLSGPKTYLVSFQNEAELRGTGGLPGAFAIVKADHGKLTFSQFEKDSTLTRTKSGLDFGAAYNQLYAGANATDEYGDSNVSAHFPYAAQIWVAMWQKYSGQHLDGAMALDPTALSYLLQVTGPATLPDKTQVTAANVVDLTQRKLYAMFTNEPARKEYLLEIARAVSTHMLGAAHGNTAGLVRAAGRAAGERRLLAWSNDPSVEADLAQTALGGAVPSTAAPFVGVAINNSSANKVDYYLDAALTWQRSGCGTTRKVTVTIKMKNNAPVGLPANVLGQTGKPGYPQHPGDDRVLVGYYATQGGALTKVTLNGVASTSAIGSELGHPVFTTNLELPRGATQTIVLNLTEPAGSGPPVMLAQPMVRPMSVAMKDEACG